MVKRKILKTSYNHKVEDLINEYLEDKGILDENVKSINETLFDGFYTIETQKLSKITV